MTRHGEGRDRREDARRRWPSRPEAQYFRATDNAKLKAIYDEINQLEKSKVEVTEHISYHERFLAVGTGGASELLRARIPALESRAETDSVKTEIAMFRFANPQYFWLLPSRARRSIAALLAGDAQPPQAARALRPHPETSRRADARGLRPGA